MCILINSVELVLVEKFFGHYLKVHYFYYV